MNQIMMSRSKILSLFLIGLMLFLVFSCKKDPPKKILSFIQQGSKLVGTDAVGRAYQGNSVSISANGNTAIIGGYNDNNGQGAAWIFTRSNGIWSQLGSKLVGTDAVGYTAQGRSVSISADGNTAILGGALDNNGQGAAWIFIRNNGIWSQQGRKLIGTGVVGLANQGESVSISADGNTAIIGGIIDNNGQGAAWIFTRSNGIWSQQGSKLVGTGGVGVSFQGESVSISADGNTAIIGGFRDNTDQGAAWIFTRNNGLWTQQGSKVVGTGAGREANQGISVSISGDGNTVIIGGSSDNKGQGAAWIFTRSNGIWTQQGDKVVGTGVVGYAYQGCSVSISGDGNTAIIGGFYDQSGNGAAWFFTHSNGFWTQLGNKLSITNDNETQGLGGSVSISADGNTAIIGGSIDNNQQGAAWIFSSN